MDRVDLFSTVHKGLRRELFAVVELAGRTDFLSPAETAGLAAALRRLLAFLGEHADHEDHHVMPRLERIAPGLWLELKADHGRLEGLQRSLTETLARLEAAAVEQRPAWGGRLGHELRLLLAEQVLHMEKEETAAQRALWAHHSDGELEEVHGRILGSIPPDRMAQWGRILLPALPGPDRARLEAALSGRV